MPDVVVVGSFVQDLSFKTDEFPVPGATRIGQFTTGPGGKGFNQAVACSRQNVDTLFLGAVGQDSFANDLKQFIENEPLAAKFEIQANCSSGAASIVVNSHGENVIVVALGANDKLSPAFIKEHSRDIQSAKILVSQAESNLEATTAAFSIARESGATTLLNPAPINYELTPELIELADILTPNETEFSFLLDHFFDRKVSNVEKCGDEELMALCKLFPCSTIVITLGSAGCFIRDGAESYRISAAAVDVVDTTGAGDAFSGGLAAGLCLFDHNLASAARYASKVAGLSVETYGTAPAMPTSEKVNNRFPNEA